MYIYFRFIIIIIVLFVSDNVFSQISISKKPVYGFSSLKTKIPVLCFDPSEEQVKSEAENKSGKFKTIKYAHLIQVNLDLKKNTTCDTLGGNILVWRINIRSANAFSLGLRFSKFKIPDGANMFVYNKNTLLGAYTSLNNKSYMSFSIEPIQGDSLTIEYSEPINSDNKGVLVLGAILHDYIDVLKYMKVSRELSGSCNVNVNCDEGIPWQKEKNAVCNLLSGIYIGTACLINNTKNDGRPFLLTAHHVIKNEKMANDAIFYFNYEQEDCFSQQTINKTNSISGSYLRSTSSNIDFSLLEISIIPPSAFTPYYAGWDRTGDIPSSVCTIHHPQGDVKKISFDLDSPISDTFKGSSYDFLKNSHWRILKWDVGVTESGSSGAPLFNQNHLIIGDLTGGDASCDEMVDDYFSKFSFAWDYFENKNEQLKYWLDPENKGVEVLYPYEPGMIELSQSSACRDEEFNLKIKAFENDVSCVWDLGEDASYSNIDGFIVEGLSFSTVGKKVIKAIITTTTGKRILSEFFTVHSNVQANFNFKIKDNIVNFVSESENATSFTWHFGDNNTSDLRKISHTFLNKGIYEVTLTVENTCSRSEKTSMINLSYNENIDIYPNPSYGCFTIDMSKILLDNIAWDIIDSRGSKVVSGVLRGDKDKLYSNFVKLKPGLYFFKMNVDGKNITRKIVII